MPGREVSSDPGAWLEKLRASFPLWGIVYDDRRRVWIAVRGKERIVRASNPIVLYTLLDSDWDQS